MASCGGAVETQTGTGRSMTIKRAIHKAFLSAKNAGTAHCLGGSCGDGQMCSYVVTDMEVMSVGPYTSPQGTSGYEATVTTDGGCACTDW
jgi:hypothetical protein